MPQAATIKSLPRAFRMMKTLQAQGIEWGEDYRRAGALALKDVLEGRMAAGVDRHLDEMAERGAADRRNGSYRRWLMTELGEIELSVPRTRSWSALAVVRAYARRAAHIDRMILACFVLGLSTRKVAIALLPILGRRISARHGEPGRQDLGCGGRRLPPPALEGHLSGLDARRRGAGAQDRHGRAPAAPSWWPWA